MATDLKQLSQAIKDSSPRTRMVAIGGALLVVVAIVLSSVLASQPHLEEMHFWQPGGNRQFRALEPGELFLCKLHRARLT